MKNLASLLLFVFAITLFCASAYGGDPTNVVRIRVDPDEPEQPINCASTEKVLAEIAQLKQLVRDVNTARPKEKTVERKKPAVVMEKKPTADSNLAITQVLAKEVAVAPATELRVNILLIDEDGNVPYCFKKVLASDITQNGKNTRFRFINEKNEYVSVDWNQKVAFSYLYLCNGPPVAGKIYYQPGASGEPLVIDVSTCDVYQDGEGIIRFDALNGKFPSVPKGSWYKETSTTTHTKRSSQ